MESRSDRPTGTYMTIHNDTVIRVGKAVDIPKRIDKHHKTHNKASAQAESAFYRVNSAHWDELTFVYGIQWCSPQVLELFRFTPTEMSKLVNSKWLSTSATAVDRMEHMIAYGFEATCNLLMDRAAGPTASSESPGFEAPTGVNIRKATIALNAPVIAARKEKAVRRRTRKKK